MPEIGHGYCFDNPEVPETYPWLKVSGKGVYTDFPYKIREKGRGASFLGEKEKRSFLKINKFRLCKGGIEGDSGLPPKGGWGYACSRGGYKNSQPGC
jgi:hypothetical protein